MVPRKSILLYPNTRAYSVAFYPQGRRFLVGSGSIESYDFENRTIASSPISGDSGGDEEQVTSLLVTPDGKSLISSSYKGDIKIWDIAGGSLRKSLRGHTKSASAGAFPWDLKL